MPCLPWKLGEIVDPLSMYRMDIDTIAVNLAGIPAISIPAGLVDGLPVGLQLMAKHFDELSLLRVSYAYERATHFSDKLPVN